MASRVCSARLAAYTAQVSNGGVRRLALLLAVVSACTGVIATPPPAPPLEPPPPEPCLVPDPLPGAPVPLRRLNRAHVEQTVRDVLGVDEALAVSDERLFTYRSNISTSVDDAAVQAYFEFTERVAAQINVARCSTDASCQAWLFDDVARRLFRRPLEGEQRARYVALYQQGRAAGGTLDVGAQWALQAMLQSPAFLYVDEPVNAEGRLDGYAVATRLALMLYGANPDEALLAAAAAGELDTAGGVRTQVRAMIQDPRCAHGLHAFVTQWLELEKLHHTDSRPDLLALGRPVLTALEQEPVEVVRTAIASRMSLGALLTTTRTVTLPALVPLYGADVRSSSGGVTELDPARRKGLLSLPGVMAALAHAGVTSPTVRGFAILSSVVCQPPQPPPAGVNATVPPVTPGSTTRQRLETHFTDPACGACHRAMDGIGFTFEHYDPAGRWRDLDNGQPIDDRAEFHLAGKAVSVDGAGELADALAASGPISECFARHWTRYATGVPDRPELRCFVRSLGERGAVSLEDLIVELAASDYVRKGAP